MTEKTQDKIIFWAGTSLCIGFVTWASWMTVQVFDRPTVDDVLATVAKETGDRLKQKEVLLQIVQGNTAANYELKESLTKLDKSVSLLAMKVDLENDRRREGIQLEDVLEAVKNVKIDFGKRLDNLEAKIK